MSANAHIAPIRADASVTQHHPRCSEFSWLILSCVCVLFCPRFPRGASTAPNSLLVLTSVVNFVFSSRAFRIPPQPDFQASVYLNHVNYPSREWPFPNAVLFRFQSAAFFCTPAPLFCPESSFQCPCFSYGTSKTRIWVHCNIWLPIESSHYPTQGLLSLFLLDNVTSVCTLNTLSESQDLTIP